MASRWPIRLMSAGLAAWYARFGLASRKPPSNPARILVAHHLLLGDTIMLAPLLKKLRARFPQAEIFMTCRLAAAPLFETRPYGVRVLPFDPRQASTFAQLFRNRGFDLAMLPADNRLSWLARALDSRWIVAFEGDRPAYKNLLVDEPEKWRALIAHVVACGMNPVLSAGPGEDALIRQIDPEGRYQSFPGSLQLVQMWHLLAGASAVVCPDTGVGHLARIAGTPAVILYGPGSALLFGGGIFWCNVPDRKVTIANFPCRDENVVFRRYLPGAEQCARTTAQCASPKCMHALTAGMAIEALDSLLAESGRRMAPA